jgi:hypothetical protein
VVITQWDWADPTADLHDLVSTDRRDPTVNARKICGALENSADYLPVLDPASHTIGQHCPEGWAFFTEPLSHFKYIEQAGSSEGSYYT